jgi:hypothetical protein
MVAKRTQTLKPRPAAPREPPLIPGWPEILPGKTGPGHDTAGEDGSSYSFDGGATRLLQIGHFNFRFKAINIKCTLDLGDIS